MRIYLDLSPVLHQKAGLGRYARTLAEHLIAQDPFNHYTAFAYGKFADAALSPELRRLPRANVPLDVRPWRMSVWLAHAAGISFDRFFPRADIFHATEHLLPPFRNVKTVFTLHDLIFQFFPEYHLPLNRWYLVNAMPHFVRRADAIIAVSECTKRDAITIYDLPPEKITVIYEGVNPALRPVEDPATISHARAHYAKNRRFILFLSTIEPRKNLIRLIDALRALHLRGFNHRLLIAGRTGWLYQDVFAHLRKTGMQDRVDLLGFVPDSDLPALMAAADAFVFPSLYEGFGLGPLEAMACGAPVVASNTSSLPEILGDAALYVNPTDTADIAVGIERVLTNPELRAELRARGLAQAAKFSWERAARETLGVYEKVTGLQSFNVSGSGKLSNLETLKH